MKNSKLNTGITKLALGASMCAALAACGGGSDGGSSSGSSAANESVTLNGQVTDGPIQAAGICLYADGQKASVAGGSPICATTQDDGTYTLSIPRKLASGFLTLVATKSGGIVLASTLGTTAQVLAAASDGKNISPGSLPGAIVTHLSTADFALADTNGDGTVSQDELAAYVPDISKTEAAATAIKAVIDYGQTNLIGGATTDTLKLASAVGQGQAMGNGQQYAQWIADPTQWQATSAGTAATLVAAVNNDVAAELGSAFTQYQVTQTTTASNIPPVVSVQFAAGRVSLYCEADAPNTVSTEMDKIAFDATRGIAVLQYTGDNGSPVSMTGSYDPKTGAFSLNENDPTTVSLNSGDVTFYQASTFAATGTVDAAGNITATFNSTSTDTWSINSTKQTCTSSGTLTASKS